MSRLLGFDTSDGSSRLSDVFDRLAVQADEAGVQWRDLVQDGYRVAGDLFAGGILIRYDWRWRIDELQRRIDESAGRTT